MMRRAVQPLAFCLLIISLVAAGASPALLPDNAQPNSRLCSTTQPSVDNKYEYHHLDVGGIDVAYTVAGQGPICVVLSFAFSIGSDVCRAGLKHDEMAFTMVVVDLPGLGSTRDPPVGWNYSLEALSDLVEAVRRNFGTERIWIMGHDDAGMIAVHYAHRFPNAIAGLILVGTCASHTSDREREGAYLLYERSKLPNGEQLYDAATRMWSSTTDSTLKSTFLQAIANYSDNEASAAKLTEICRNVTFRRLSLARLSQASQAWNVTDELGALKAPTLVIGSTWNIYSPLQEVEQVHLKIAGSKCLVISDAGVFPWIDCEKKFYWAFKYGTESVMKR